MKIIIAGAGIGGMVAAERLGKLGFDVTVYEKAASLDEMRYDWHDDVAPRMFRRLGIPIPEEHFKKKSWTFVTPFESHIQEFAQDETDPDLSVERRPLNRLLYDRAKDVALFKFGANITAPVVKDGRVCGVVVDGVEQLCDFVVDSAGAYSPVRRGLPKEMGVTELKDDEKFVAYRAFIQRNPNVPDPKYGNKVYLKHLGGAGISWSILDNDPTQVNVLIGKVGALPEEEKTRLLNDLKANNPIIGEDVVRGGYNTIIPIRYPATKMVADGYAAIGDAAYMTIPLLGSGIATSMLAGSILGEVIGRNMSKGVKGKALFDTAKLWRYQVECYREFGAEHCGVDTLKRWMLSAQTELIVWLFKQQIINNEDTQVIASGGKMKMTPKAMINKVKAAGIKKIPALLRINTVLTRSAKAERIGKNIPRNYNEGIVKNWEKRLQQLFEKGEEKNIKALKHEFKP